MPSLFYDKLFDIGNGKKFGVLFIDSCFLLCSNYSYNEDQDTSPLYTKYIDRDLIKLRDDACSE